MSEKETKYIEPLRIEDGIPYYWKAIESIDEIDPEKFYKQTIGECWTIAKGSSWIIKSRVVGCGGTDIDMTHFEEVHPSEIEYLRSLEDEENRGRDYWAGEPNFYRR